MAVAALLCAFPVVAAQPAARSRSTAAPATPPAASGPVVAAVELHLPAGFDAAGLPALITVRKGERLSTRAVRESISRLWQTERFADVEVRAVPGPEGVTVVFELVAKQCIELVGVEYEKNPYTEGKPRVLDTSTVIAASGLAVRPAESNRCPEAAEYYPERLRHAVDRVKRAYHRRGHDHADVTLDLFEQTSGIVVVIRVQEGLPTRIAGITAAGDPGFPLARLIEEAKLQVGAVLDQDQVDRGLGALRDAFRRERYYRARVAPPVIERVGREATLSLPISAGPRYTLAFAGTRSFSDALLRGVINYDGSETLDAAVVARLERRLLAFYRYRGFPDASVTTREVVRPDGTEAQLVFAVEEGFPLFVAELEFAGVTGRDVEEGTLREVAQAHVRARAPELAPVRMADDPLSLEGRVNSVQRGAPLPEPGNVYIEEAFKEAADSMTELYRDRGYLSASVRLAEVTRDLREHRAVVRFEVTEGPKTTVRSVTVEGAPSEVRVQGGLPLRPGMALSAAKVEEGRTRLAQELARRGYLYAAVQAITSVERDGRDGSVTYQVDPGAQAHVGEVLLRGYDRTNEDILRANLAFRPGDVLDPELLFESQRNLLLTGGFRQVTVRLLDPEAEEERKDVEVVIRERARYSGEIAGGFSLAEGPRLVLDANAPNVGGNGLNIAARGKLNYVGASALALFPRNDTNATTAGGGFSYGPDELEGFDGLGGRGNISFVYPRLYPALPTQIGAHLDLVGERVHRQYYFFTRFAAIAGLDWTAPAQDFAKWVKHSGWLTARIQGELEHDRVFFPAGVTRLVTYEATQLNERFPEGNFTLGNVRSEAMLDLRDDPANPTRGFTFAASGELTRNLLDPTKYDPEQDREVPLTVEGSDGRVFTFDIYSIKASANATVYLPVTSRVVFAASGRAGRIFHLFAESERQNTIVPKRFFLGGSSTMRGFREDAVVPQDRREQLNREIRACQALISIAGCTPEARDIVLAARRETPEQIEPASEGGEFFVLGKAELRFPAFASLDMGLFFEAGNLWAKANEADIVLSELRYVAGVGLRFPTVIGPLAFDVGFNLLPDALINEPRVNFHFSIGLF